MDDELTATNAQELEHYAYIFDKPNHYNISPETNLTQETQYLYEELFNMRKNISKVIDIGKYFKNIYNISQSNNKELSKESSEIIEKYEEATYYIDICEKKIDDSEIKIEQLKKEIEQLEKSLKKSQKKKSLLEIDIGKFYSNQSNRDFTEKKSLDYIESTKSTKVSQMQAELNKKSDIIDELDQLLTTLEGKIEAEQKISDNLRSKIHKLQNEIVEKNHKINQVKLKNDRLKRENLKMQHDSYEENERELETQESADANKEKSLEKRADVLSDLFFTPDVHNKKDHIELFETEKFCDNVSYFITSPPFSFRRSFNLQIHRSCSEINISKHIEKKASVFTFEEIESDNDNAEIAFPAIENDSEEKLSDRDVNDEELSETIIKSEKEDILEEKLADIIVNSGINQCKNKMIVEEIVKFKENQAGSCSAKEEVHKIEEKLERNQSDNKEKIPKTALKQEDNNVKELTCHAIIEISPNQNDKIKEKTDNDALDSINDNFSDSQDPVKLYFIKVLFI